MWIGHHTHPPPRRQRAGDRDARGPRLPIPIGLSRRAVYIGLMARAMRPMPAAIIPSISSVSKRLVAWK